MPQRLLDRTFPMLLAAAVAFCGSCPAVAQSSEQFWASTLTPAGKPSTARGSQTRRSSVSRPASTDAIVPLANRHSRLERRAAQQSNVFLADYGAIVRMTRSEPMASGEPFNPQDLVAAHASLPIGSSVLVSELQSGRSVVLLVKDRSNVGGAALELSPAALRVLGVPDKTVDKARVRLMAVWVPTGEPMFWPRLGPADARLVQTRSE